MATTPRKIQTPGVTEPAPVIETPKPTTNAVPDPIVSPAPEPTNEALLAEIARLKQQLGANGQATTTTEPKMVTVLTEHGWTRKEV